MTRKIYKSAMGKTVDLGALLLQNEQVRAVGNMGVNAAGDLLDSTNRVIEQRSRQVQRQYRRQTNVSNTPIATSNLDAKKMSAESQTKKEAEMLAELDQEFESGTDVSVADVVTSPDPVVDSAAPGAGGLAAAIARNREIKQELEKTRKQRLQEQGLKKI